MLSVTSLVDGPVHVLGAQHRANYYRKFALTIVSSLPEGGGRGGKGSRGLYELVQKKLSKSRSVQYVKGIKGVPVSLEVYERGTCCKRVRAWTLGRSLPV